MASFPALTRRHRALGNEGGGKEFRVCNKFSSTDFNEKPVCSPTDSLAKRDTGCAAVGVLGLVGALALAAAADAAVGLEGWLEGGLLAMGSSTSGRGAGAAGAVLECLRIQGWCSNSSAERRSSGFFCRVWKRRSGRERFSRGARMSW